MLKQETINKLAALAKIKPDELLSAIKSEDEKDIEIPKLTAYDETELETLKDNEYKRGKKAGVEMDVKDAKEKLGLEFQGKTIEGLLEAYQKKVQADSKIEPNQKLDELNEKVKTLQTTVKDYEAKLAEKDNEVSGVKINSELYKHIPAPGDNGPALGADDVIQLMKANGYEFKLENGSIVPYKGGKQLTDKLSNALPVNDVVSEFLKEKKLIVEKQVIAGRGGSNSSAPSNTPSTMAELKKQFQEQNKSLLGTEFRMAAEKYAQDVPGFKESMTQP